MYFSRPNKRGRVEDHRTSRRLQANQSYWKPREELKNQAARDQPSSRYIKEMRGQGCGTSIPGKSEQQQMGTEDISKDVKKLSEENEIMRELIEKLREQVAILEKKLGCRGDPRRRVTNQQIHPDREGKEGPPNSESGD